MHSLKLLTLIFTAAMTSQLATATNASDSSFVIHLSNSELLKAEIIEQSTSKQNARLQDEFQKQRDHLKQDIDSKLEQRLKLQQSTIIEDMNKIMEKNVKSAKDTLLKELKHLFEEQQKINDEQLRNTISLQYAEKKSLPTTCAEGFLHLGYAKSGIYQLYTTDLNLATFGVYCIQDPKNGTAWTIIQRRQDNSTDLNCSWAEYKRGFGNLKSNYWIGLDKLHAMTQAEPHELWIQLEDFKGEKRYANYDRFAIGSECEKYALNLVGKYSGDAGDALDEYHSLIKFSTHDNDNDQFDTGNCASTYKGGWWFNKCYRSNLNGPYLNENESKASIKGIIWSSWRGLEYSLKYAHMAIRPRK